MHAAQLDPRIGMLSNGKFYAFVHGLAKPETVGTLQEIKQALGINKEHASVSAKSQKMFDVVLRFSCPAWDEVDGISYTGICAESKSHANRIARKQAERDGHAIGGRGRYTFTATES